MDAALTRKGSLSAWRHGSEGPEPEVRLAGIRAETDKSETRKNRVRQNPHHLCGLPQPLSIHPIDHSVKSAFYQQPHALGAYFASITKVSIRYSHGIDLPSCRADSVTVGKHRTDKWFLATRPVLLWVVQAVGSTRHAARPPPQKLEAFKHQFRCRSAKTFVTRRLSRTSFVLFMEAVISRCRGEADDT
jgi:hypothetical protein